MIGKKVGGKGGGVVYGNDFRRTNGVKDHRKISFLNRIKKSVYRGALQKELGREEIFL